MKKPIEKLTDQEKLNSIYNWAVAIQATFYRQKEKIVKVSRDEMIEKMQEVIDVTKEART